MPERLNLGSKIKTVATSNEVFTITTGAAATFEGYSTAEQALNGNIVYAAFFGLGTLIFAVWAVSGAKNEVSKIRKSSGQKEPTVF